MDIDKVHLGVMGLRRAIERLETATGEITRVVALTEVVWWGAAIAELVWPKGSGRPDILLAIRGARNASIHNLVRTSNNRGGGLTVPFSVPLSIPSGQLTWDAKAVDFMDHANERQAYRCELADRAVEGTLGKLVNQLAKDVHPWCRPLADGPLDAAIAQHRQQAGLE